jgi:hypothetical protein
MNGASGAAVDDTREEMVSEPRGHGAARHEGRKSARTDNSRANSACMTSLVGAVPTNATRSPLKTIATVALFAAIRPQTVGPNYLTTPTWISFPGGFSVNDRLKLLNRRYRKPFSSGAHAAGARTSTDHQCMCAWRQN